MIDKMFQGYELNLRDYGVIFLKRKWLMIFTFFFVFISNIIFTHLQPTLYRTGALIKIEPVINLDSIFPQRYYPSPFELADCAKELVSNPIIEKALKKSGIVNEDTSEQELNGLIAIVSGSLLATIIERTNMIKIEMVSEDPESVAAVVNNLVKAYKEENIIRKNQQIRNSREFIEEQLQKVSTRLRESEDKLNRLILQGIGGLAVSIITNIAELETRRSDLLTKYTDLYPDIIKIDEQISSLKERLKTLPKEEFEFSTLKRDVRINEKLYNLLRERLQEVQIRESEKIDNVVLINSALPPHYPFSPNIARNYTIGAILGIILGILVVFIVEHFDISIGRMEDLENITGVKVIGIIPYLASKSGGVKDVFRKRKGIFLEKFKNKLRGIISYFVQKSMNIKGAFRKKKGVSDGDSKEENKTERLQNQLIIKCRENSIFLESFRILGANVQIIFGAKGKIKKKCILITSSNPQEGKSLISANLAIIMAQMGYKTLLMDMDLRRSVLHKMFGLASKKGGVSDILKGEITFESAVKTATDLFLGDMNQEDLLKNPWMDRLHILTAGTTFSNGPYLLNTNKMSELRKIAGERYDVIIMDSSPILAVSDTSIVSRHVDGILLVYRAGDTSRIALHRAKLQVENVKGEKALRGIILNNVTPEISMDTYYYYQRRSYYSDRKKEEDKVTLNKNV